MKKEIVFTSKKTGRVQAICLVTIFVWLWSGIVSIGYAQENSIQVIAKSKKNEIWLRWAPSNAYVWELGNKYGYIVERFTMTSQGKFNEDFAQHPKLLSKQPVKPYSKDEFQKLGATDEKAEAFAELLYSEQARQAYPSTPAGLLKRNQQQENRFGMALLLCDLSQTVAIAAGVMWVDKSMVVGPRYAYRIRLAQKPPGVTIEDGVFVIESANEIPLLAPRDLEATFNDQSATLKWPVLADKGTFSAYYVEKSVDGKTFKPLSDLPYTNFNQLADSEYMFLQDSLANNEQTFYYRIKGITPFAEVSPPSTVVSGKGRRPLEAIVSIDSSAVINKQQIFLHWNLPTEYEKWIKGFIVNRSDKPDGPYQDITPQMLPVHQRTFIDKSPNQQNYYRIKYIAKEKKEGREDSYFSFPYLAQVADETPPAPPVGLTGKVDSTGVVFLQWNDGKEADLFGYRVYRANSLKEEFREITPRTLKQTGLYDTIPVNTLTKKVYYKVVAVDRNYNPSAYSSPLTLNRPDRIAPVAPVFRIAQVKGDSIQLQWTKSSSDDVSRYHLYRQEKENRVSVKEWTSSTVPVAYAEKDLIVGQRYTYILQAIDSAGNIGEVTSREIWYETGVREGITPSVIADRKKNLIRVSWKYTQPGVSKYVLYRAKESQPLVIYQTLDATTAQFEDTSVTVGTTYSYCIKAFFKGGMQSVMSKPVTVSY
ncbi:hypothetical protein QNI16_20880 [Cytophagaceae bacterium YF14B1]|uniref:Fibronectin type-III domain-containing protein n=1 Tax=Xanthocytophaga flava TaxID=3048013 RepID=A0AAE3QPM9_9BACT|nr:hypothetical protein [Xanthocytophaga flavus]MDJ1482970.1 hypothetical protein [Xanthocytophaga flavus]